MEDSPIGESLKDHPGHSPTGFELTTRTERPNQEVFIMTKLVHFSPRADLSRMQRDFDSLFNSFFPSSDADEANNEPVNWHPRIDLVETTEAFELAVDLPGVSKDEVIMNLHDGVLSISGERTARELEDSDTVVRLERQTGRFHRSFTLSNKIDESKIEARHENGVLLVRLPKLEESKPRKISIK
jgi:HSP20 family protein